MTFDEYQKLARRTDLAQDVRDWNDVRNFEKLLGLAGESGEFLDKFKKILRDKKGVVSSEGRDELTKELGDILWYIAIIAEHLDVKFSDIAEGNIAKLADRQKRNVIHGAGDNR
jgi:NTP pyrophosphatase (non-canonical NTP hydrolase)